MDMSISQHESVHAYSHILWQDVHAINPSLKTVGCWHLSCHRQSNLSGCMQHATICHGFVFAFLVG